MALPPDVYIDLVGRMTAQNLLLRALFTRWAAQTPQPRAVNRHIINGMIESMAQAVPPDSEAEAQVWSVAQDALREFGEQIDIRLSGEGFRE